MNTCSSAHGISKQPCYLSIATINVQALPCHRWDRRWKVYWDISFLASVKDKKTHFFQLKQYQRWPDVIPGSVELHWRGAQSSLELEVRLAELVTIYLKTENPACYHDFKELKATQVRWNSEVNATNLKGGSSVSSALFLSYFETWEDTKETWQVLEIKSNPL